MFANEKNFAFVLAITLAVAFGTLLTARAEESERPKSFSGYLLDKRGFEEKKTLSAWRENFESQGVSWRLLYQDGEIIPTARKRVDEVFHDGKQSEFIQYEVEEPGVVVLGHYVDYPEAFKETNPSVWTRSDRPGVTIAALVVFPKTPRPDTGEALTAILLGDSYQKTGDWQRLAFPQGLDKALEEATQALRGEHKIAVERDCAYVRQILLITEARHGRYNLWIDDLEIAEHIRPNLDSLRRWERGARFNPINLLSCRLKITNAPVFWQDEATETDEYGTEPFGLDQEKIARNNRRPLQFSDKALKERRSDEDFQKEPRSGFGSTLEYLDKSDSFDESLAFIPSFEYDFGSLKEKIEGTNSSIGLVDFLSKQNDSKGVASIGFDEMEKQVEAPSENKGEYMALSPVDDLISGSGTLDVNEESALESFVQKGEKIEFDASFNDGVFETSDGRVVFVRAIEYQGESLNYLKKLGFNAVKIDGAPTASLLKEAAAVGMRLVASPPIGAETVTQADVDKIPDASRSQENSETKIQVRRPQTSSPSSKQGQTVDYFGGRAVDSAYAPVLAWNMGAELRRESVAELRQEIQKIQSLDSKLRPCVGSVVNGVDEYSSEGGLKVLLLDRAPLLSSLDMNDYGDWLVRYQSLPTGFGVFWNTIQTQPTPMATKQRQFFGAPEESPGVVSYEQIRQLVRLSLRAGCRGLVFASNSRLDLNDRKTQYRRAALESINLEIRFLAPWFALGNAKRDELKTSSPNLSCVLSRTTRSLLALPVSNERNNQYAMGQNAAYNWSGTVAVGEGYLPDLLTPGALRKVVSKRRAGGRSFQLDEASLNSLIFFTQSDALSQRVAERAAIIGKRAAELAISLGRKRLDLYEQTVHEIKYVEEHGAFAKSSPHSPILGEVVDSVRQKLNEAEKYLERQDYSQACLVAERATREVRENERRFWLEATKNEIARPVTPLSTSFYDMPAYLELYEKIISGKIKTQEPNLIAGGDMEDSAQAWRDNGWRVYTEDSALVRGETFLDRTAARTGKQGLRAVVSTRDGGEGPSEVESPSLFVETSFPSRVGQIICVQGWIKIPQTLKNSVDGVEIYDDQGGEGLALRFKNACGWKRFAFYRLATNEGTMRIRIACSGVGEVWLDDLGAYVVE